MSDFDPPALPPETDPEAALASVLALRQLADRLERRAVRAALAGGWSWAQIAQCLNISKQAAHKRLAHLTHASDGENDV